MKLTEERLVKMILEELDAMGEAYRGSAGQPLSRAQRRAARMKRRTGGPGTMEPRKKGTEEEEAKRTAKRALDLAARPTLMMIRKDIENEKKTQYDVERDVYNYIKKLSRDDQDVLDRLTIKED
tara:strand:+ start:1459 stop:1830 length:372 start_codon:yes stop_codon:yes gene_type:complete